ncbi:MAG: subtilisin family serine protease [Bradymonadia bacterium]
MRHFLLLLLALLPLSVHAASPYDWRAYPNGDRTFIYDLSSEWLLLDQGRVDSAKVAQSLAAHAPDALIADIVQLLPGRVAIQVVGVEDAEALRRIGEGLVQDGVAGTTWPAVTRQTGVGFFDQHLAVAFDGVPDDALLKRVGVQLVRESRMPGVWSAVADDGDAVGAAWALSGQPGVRWVEPDLIRDVTTYELPDDPEIGDQWHLENAENVGDIQAEAAWATTTGSPDIIMGIFDSGFDMDHPDLAPNIVGGFDAIDRDDDPEAGCGQSPDGAGPAGSCPNNTPYRESHGTAVAGVVAARGDNQIGGTGVCPDCSLYVVRIIGGSSFRSLSNAEAFSRAEEAGVDVINNSWGPRLTRFFPLAQAEREVFNRITTEGREGKGVVLVFAAGNDFFTPATANPYASHPGVITVSASTRIDDFACYSNYGEVIAIAGPSRGCYEGETGIATTDYQGGEGYSNEAFTRNFGGTSAAAPVVAGVAGLVLSANPDLTAQQVRLVLQRSAVKINADKNPWEQQIGVDLEALFAYDDNGFSTGFGYGRVDAAAAVAAALDPGLVAGTCDAACPRCIDDRCAPDCAVDADCPGAARCVDVEGEEGALACVIPAPQLGDIGQPCTLECTVCVDTADSRSQAAAVCTDACEGDDDCPFGFDCRTLRDNAPQVCIPGNAECGERWGSVRCQSEVRVSGGGVDFCSCDCVPGAQGACPDGFVCGNANCERTRDGIRCDPTRLPGNYFPTCFPDPDFRAACEFHRDCSNGLFCIDGLCGPDDAEAGCDTCTPCTDDDACTGDAVCVGLSRGPRCLSPCDFDNPVCPGETICADLPGPDGDHCVNPDYARKGICPSAWRCEIDGRCLADEDCEDGVSCGENVCEGDDAEPDAGVESDMAVADAGVTDAAAPADATVIVESDQAARGSDGCAAAPGSNSTPSAWWICLGVLGVVRRRRS